MLAKGAAYASSSHCKQGTCLHHSTTTGAAAVTAAALNPNAQTLLLLLQLLRRRRRLLLQAAQVNMTGCHASQAQAALLTVHTRSQYPPF